MLIIGLIFILFSTVIGRALVLLLFSGVNLTSEYNIILSGSIISVDLVGILVFMYGAMQIIISSRK